MNRIILAKFVKVGLCLSVLTGLFSFTAAIADEVYPVALSEHFIVADSLQAIDLKHGQGAHLLTVGRSWTNLKLVDQPFGSGWSDPYRIRLFRVNKNMVAIFRGGIAWRVAYRQQETFKTSADETIKQTQDGWVLSDGSGTKIQFTGTGRVSEIIGNDGMRRQFDYGIRGELLTVSDTEQNFVKFEYDATGRVTEVQGPESLRATFEYNADGKLSRVTNYRGSVVNYKYDHIGRLAEVEDSFGNKLPYSPMSISYRESADDQYTQTQIDLVSDQEKEDDESETESELFDDVKRDQFGRLVSYRNGDTMVSITYNRFDQPTMVNRSDGLWVRYDYDQHGRRIRQESSDGEWLKMVYDAAGRLSQISHSSGVSERYEFGATGRVVQVHYSDGNAVQYQYDDDGAVIAEHWASGEKLQWEYGDSGAVKKFTSTTGLTTKRGFHRDASALWEQDEVYDLRTLRRSGSQLEFRGHGFPSLTANFDTAEKVVALTRNGVSINRFQYDNSSHVTQSMAPSGRIWKYRYNNNGTLSQVKTPQGLKHEILYDSKHRVQSIRRGSVLVRSFRYDADGRISEVETRDGVAERYRYDTRGRVVESLIADEQVAFQHDDANRLLLIQSKLYRIQQAFNQSGGLSRRLYEPADFDLGFPIDVFGRSAGIRLNDIAVEYQYDDRGQLASIVLPGQSKIQIRRDQAGRPTEFDFNGIMSTALSYDVMDRIRSIQTFTSDANVSFQEGYEFDGMGNLTTIDIGLLQQINYSYDIDDRLIRSESQDEKIQYSYDDDDNLLAIVGDDQSQTWRLDANGRPVASTNDETIVWSDSGNIAAVIGENVEKSNHFDSAGQMVLSYGPQGTFRHGYLPNGTRIWSSGPKGVRWYAYHGQRLVAFKDEAKTNWLVVYLPDSDIPLALCGSNGVTYYCVVDRLGSLRRLMDDQGQKVGHIDYGPYGKTVRSEGDFPVRFFAGMVDDPNDFHYALARYYDPQLARFISVDPELGEYDFPATHNPYAYAANNPLRYRDTLGMQAGGSNIMTKGDSAGVMADILKAKQAKRPTGAVSGLLDNDLYRKAHTQVALNRVSREVKFLKDHKDVLGKSADDISKILKSAVEDIGKTGGDLTTHKPGLRSTVKEGLARVELRKAIDDVADAAKGKNRTAYNAALDRLRDTYNRIKTAVPKANLRDARHIPGAMKDMRLNIATAHAYAPNERVTLFKRIPKLGVAFAVVNTLATLDSIGEARKDVNGDGVLYTTAKGAVLYATGWGIVTTTFHGQLAQYAWDGVGPIPGWYGTIKDYYQLLDEAERLEGDAEKMHKRLEQALRDQLEGKNGALRADNPGQPRLRSPALDPNNPLPPVDPIPENIKDAEERERLRQQQEEQIRIRQMEIERRFLELIRIFEGNINEGRRPLAGIIPAPNDQDQQNYDKARQLIAEHRRIAEKAEQLIEVLNKHRTAMKRRLDGLSIAINYADLLEREFGRTEKNLDQALLDLNQLVKKFLGESDSSDPTGKWDEVVGLAEETAKTICEYSSRKLTSKDEEKQLRADAVKKLKSLSTTINKTGRTENQEDLAQQVLQQIEHIRRLSESVISIRTEINQLPPLPDSVESYERMMDLHQTDLNRLLVISRQLINLRILPSVQSLLIPYSGIDAIAVLIEAEQESRRARTIQRAVDDHSGFVSAKDANVKEHKKQREKVQAVMKKVNRKLEQVEAKLVDAKKTVDDEKVELAEDQAKRRDQAEKFMKDGWNCFIKIKYVPKDKAAPGFTSEEIPGFGRTGELGGGIPGFQPVAGMRTNTKPLIPLAVHEPPFMMPRLRPKKRTQVADAPLRMPSLKPKKRTQVAESPNTLPGSKPMKRTEVAESPNRIPNRQPMKLKSSGVAVPSLIGKSAEQVQSTLQTLGLRPDFKMGHASPSVKNQYKVYQQKPVAKTMVDKNSQVTVTLFNKMGGAPKRPMNPKKVASNQPIVIPKRPMKAPRSTPNQPIVIPKRPMRKVIDVSGTWIINARDKQNWLRAAATGVKNGWYSTHIVITQNGTRASARYYKHTGGTYVETETLKQQVPRDGKIFIGIEDISISSDGNTLIFSTQVNKSMLKMRYHRSK